MTPREAGIQAFYADEGTTNTLQGLNAAFDAYEAALIPVGEQWRACEDGSLCTPWHYENQGDRAGWQAIADRKPAIYRIETRPIYAKEA